MQWESEKYIFFVGRQDVVGFRDFSSKIFSTFCHNSLISKKARHDQREMFVKKSLRDQLVRFTHFVEMFLPACLPPACCFLNMAFFRILLPLPIRFKGELVQHSLQLFWNFFPQLTTSAICSTTSSNKSASTGFAAGTIYSRKKGTLILPITGALSPKPLPRYRPIQLQNGIPSCFEATIVYRPVRLKCITGAFIDI